MQELIVRNLGLVRPTGWRDFTSAFKRVCGFPNSEGVRTKVDDVFPRCLVVPGGGGL